MNEIDIALYAGFMVYLSKNHPDLYSGIQGLVPRQVRALLNEELGTDVRPGDGMESGIRMFMSVLKSRELADKQRLWIPLGSYAGDGGVTRNIPRPFPWNGMVLFQASPSNPTTSLVDKMIKDATERLHLFIEERVKFHLTAMRLHRATFILNNSTVNFV